MYKVNTEGVIIKLIAPYRNWAISILTVSLTITYIHRQQAKKLCS